MAATGAQRLTLVAHMAWARPRLPCLPAALWWRQGEALVTMGSPHHGTFTRTLANGGTGGRCGWEPVVARA